jgi:sRNA-binding regulator protein Hfq
MIPLKIICNILCEYEPFKKLSIYFADRIKSFLFYGSSLFYWKVVDSMFSFLSLLIKQNESILIYKHTISNISKLSTKIIRNEDMIRNSSKNKKNY